LCFLNFRFINKEDFKRLKMISCVIWGITWATLNNQSIAYQYVNLILHLDIT
jgi:hypothetical protein